MNIKDAIEEAIESINQQMIDLGVTEGTRYSYYQGKIDGMRDCLDALDQEQL
jgi:hypothetical protein